MSLAVSRRLWGDVPGDEEFTDERDRWPDGLIRHLRLAGDCPPGSCYALRTHPDAYTLVVHPKYESRADELRASLEPTL